MPPFDPYSGLDGNIQVGPFSGTVKRRRSSNAELGTASAWDPAAKAVMDGYTVEGLVLTDNERNWINKTVLDLKSSTIVNHTEFFYCPKIGKTNWITPGTYDLIPVYTDRPIMIRGRGFGSNGSNSNFRNGFIQKTHSTKATANGLYLGAWYGAATPDRFSAADIGFTHAIASTQMLVRGSTDQMRINANDLNFGTILTGATPVVNADGSGWHAVQRRDASTKWGWKGNARLGDPISRAAIDLSQGEFYCCGTGSTVFNQRQLEIAIYADPLIGLETALYSIVSALSSGLAVAPVLPYAPTFFGDSWPNGSGGTTNVGLAILVAYLTGTPVNNLAQGGTSRLTQKGVFLAHPEVFNSVVCWLEGIDNGAAGYAANRDMVLDVITAGMTKSKLLAPPSAVIGPPSPGVTDVALIDQNNFMAEMIANGVPTWDMQTNIKNRNSVADATSTAANLIGPAQTQGDVHLNAFAADPTAAALITQLLTRY